MPSNKINTTTNPIASDALTMEEISPSVELLDTLICNGPIINIRKYETIIIILHMMKIRANNPNNLIMILFLS
jgi:hypothetical protein